MEEEKQPEEKEQVEEQPEINELLGYGMSKVIAPIDFEGRVEDFVNNELIF